MADQFITNPTIYGTSEGAPISNLFDGGQRGIGIQPSMFDAAAPLVWTPTQIIVLQTPQMYAKKFPEFGRAIKVMMESWAKNVDGINFGYEMDTNSQPIGNDGQNWDSPGKTKRTAVSPSFTYPEITGNVFWNIHRKWMNDIQDADTNAAMTFDDDPGIFAPSQYSVSILAVQLDPTAHHSRMIDCGFICNMFPKNTTELGLGRELGSYKTMDRAIPYTGYLIHNDQVRAIGRKIVETLGIRRANYMRMSPGVTTVDGTIRDAGLKRDLNAILATTNDASKIANSASV